VLAWREEVVVDSHLRMENLAGLPWEEERVV
jgi:hypothetical protein